jgi:integrase/recombinase XerD
MLADLTMVDKLADSINVFLHYMANQRRVAPNTVAAYHNDLRQFREYVASCPELEVNESGFPQMDAAAVAGFVLYLREKGYAQATVARKIAAVKSFFQYAAEVGLVTDNPASTLDSPRVRRVAPRAVSPAEVNALIDDGCAGDMPDDLRNRAMLTLLYHSGMRVSEVVALDVADIDVNRATIRCRGRNNRVRMIPLAVPALEALRAYLTDGRPYLTRGEGEEDEGLFLNHRGTRLTRQGFWLIMKDRARQAGVVTPMTPHTLRHSFALHHLGNGTGLRELKELLGHVNISTTQIYTLSEQSPVGV